jgi:hypothetical protein
MIPYGTKYTVGVSGSIWKPVVCENCGCVYVYQIKHQTSGSATNLLWLNKQGAINSARFNANRNLEKYLKKQVRNYPCPECGFYQAEMIKRMKKNIWQQAIAVGGIAFVLIIILTASSSSPLFYALLSSGIVGSFSLRKLVGFDPNDDAPTRSHQKFSENSYPVLRKSDIELLRPPNL